MWAWIGAALALAGASAALLGARAGTRNAFADEVYGMTRRSHVRFAVLSGAFAAVFFCGAFVPHVPVFGVLAVYVLALTLYASSFARGFSD